MVHLASAAIEVLDQASLADGYDATSKGAGILAAVEFQRFAARATTTISRFAILRNTESARWSALRVRSGLRGRCPENREGALQNISHQRHAAPRLAGRPFTFSIAEGCGPPSQPERAPRASVNRLPQAVFMPS